MQPDFQKLRGLTHGVHISSAPVRRRALDAALAAAGAAADGTEQPQEHDAATADGILRLRLLIEASGAGAVRFASHDLSLEGFRIAVKVGSLHGECVLKQMAKDQLFGEVAFTRDLWSALPADAALAFELLEPAPPFKA